MAAYRSGSPTLEVFCDLRLSGPDLRDYREGPSSADDGYCNTPEFLADWVLQREKEERRYGMGLGEGKGLGAGPWTGSAKEGVLRWKALALSGG